MSNDKDKRQIELGENRTGVLTVLIIAIAILVLALTGNLQ